MRAARIVVLAVAIGAGGIAAYLASGSKEPPPAAPAPVVQIETTDILVAKGDINMGQVVSAQDIQWQTWPTTAASSYFVPDDGKTANRRLNMVRFGVTTSATPK